MPIFCKGDFSTKLVYKDNQKVWENRLILVKSIYKLQTKINLKMQTIDPSVSSQPLGPNSGQSEKLLYRPIN